MKKPTLKVQLAAKKFLEKIAEGKPFSMGEVMRAVGFSKATSINPGANLTNTDAFQKLLKKLVNEEKVLEKIVEIMESEDKRVALEASKELLKLLDRYPAGKLRIGKYEGEIKDVFD